MLYYFIFCLFLLLIAFVVKKFVDLLEQEKKIEQENKDRLINEVSKEKADDVNLSIKKEKVESKTQKKSKKKVAKKKKAMPKKAPPPQNNPFRKNN
jgi:Skp family chaperone for outer membrane proteins